MSGAPLADADLRLLEGHLVPLYALRDRGGVVDHLIDLLPRLIDADLYSYIEADPTAGRFSAIRRPQPDSEQMLDIFAPMAPSHPVIRHVAESGATAAFRVSDFLSPSAWHAQPMYREFMRPERIEHQLGATLPVNPLAMTFLAAHRSGGPDFSDRDRVMLTALAPHATRALLNAELLTRIDYGGDVIEASPSGRIRWTSAHARETLADFFGLSLARGDRLPEALLPRRSNRAVFERGTRRLRVSRTVRKDCLVLVLQEGEAVAPRLELRALGLSPREIDVVVWVAEGKSNADIGEILGVSPLTVKKHLGSVFTKLGVDGRTAAALRVRHLADRRQ